MVGIPISINIMKHRRVVTARRAIVIGPVLIKPFKLMRVVPIRRRRRGGPVVVIIIIMLLYTTRRHYVDVVADIASGRRLRHLHPVSSSCCRIYFIRDSFIA